MFKLLTILYTYQVYAELRQNRVWTKEPETGARPARKRKRTMSGSSTGSSEPSLSQMSQMSQLSQNLEDAAATPPALTSRSNSVYREGINQGRVSDEEDDNVSIKKDHYNEAFYQPQGWSTCAAG